MISSAKELIEKILENGFIIKSKHYQEEDLKNMLDAEIEIGHNLVIQINYNGKETEFSLTLEKKQKKKDSKFKHIGYYTIFEDLLKDIKENIPPENFGIYLKKINKESNKIKPTWGNLIMAEAENKIKFSTHDIYESLKNHPFKKTNQNYKATIRRWINDSPKFVKLKKGENILKSEYERKKIDI